MKVTVTFKGKTKQLDMDKNSEVRNVFEKMDVNPETVIVKKGGEIILEEEKLKDGDKLELIRVVSGG